MTSLVNRPAALTDPAMAGRGGGINRPKFTIEDAFEEDAPEEVVTMYGATTERSPLRQDISRGGERREDLPHSLLSLPDVDVRIIIYFLGGEGKGCFSCFFVFFRLLEVFWWIVWGFDEFWRFLSFFWWILSFIGGF